MTLLSRAIVNATKATRGHLLQHQVGAECCSEEGSIDGDGYRVLMEQSLRDAIEATKVVNTVRWDVDSIRSMALSLFIQRVKMS